MTQSYFKSKEENFQEDSDQDISLLCRRPSPVLDFGLIQANGVGLIVMGARESLMLADHAPWATLSDVIRESRCPVLAVQPHLA